MKLVWSPDRASLAYIDTVQSCELHRHSGVAELVSAMAAGWDAQLIVETWSQNGVMMTATATTSIGLAVATRHTRGRHVCIVPDEQSRTVYLEAVGGGARISPEVIVGEAEEVMGGLPDIDFLVVDCRRRDFAGVLRQAKLSSRGAILVCKNASYRAAASFRWGSVVEGQSRRLVRSVYLPVGNGLDIAHVATSGSGSGLGKTNRKWIKHVDQASGEEHVIRKMIC